MRFAVACAAAVIGLSGFWRLPFLVETYGGGTFLLVYVLAVVTLGLPLLSGQLLLARGTGADLPGVMAFWMRAAPHSRAWVWVGALAVVGSSLLLVCYSVVAAWSMAYGVRGAAGMLGGLDLLQSRALFYGLARDAEKGFGWQLVFVGLAVATAAQGLRQGLEPVMRTLALLIALLLTLLLFLVSLEPEAGETVRALFVPDFAALTWRGVLEALYLAFFTLSLGTGVVVALGSYLPPRARVVRLALAVLVLDMLATLAAAFVFGVLLRHSDALLGGGLEQVFIVLPAVLDASWQLALVYTLITLVALAAAIGLLEPLMCVLQRRLQWSRLRASLHAGVLVWLGGLIGLLSFGVLGDVRWDGVNLFGWLLQALTNVVLPAVGLAYCLFLGHVLARQRLSRAWHGAAEAPGSAAFAWWHGLLRYPARVVLVVVLLYSLGGVGFVTWLWS